MANGTLAASQIEMLSLSGTGIITITPPATNTNRAITLPDAAGAIVVSGTTPSLNGIAFPATQSASADANTLDDYEEGTFSPTIRGSGTVGTATYSRQIGIYTKIGNRVFFTISISWSSGTGSGALLVGNLPFTQNGDAFDIPYFISESSDITWDSGYFPTPAGGHNSVNIFINQSRLGATGTSINTNYDASGTLQLGGSYKIA